MIVASSGDNSYTAGPQQPCSFSTVTCIGGTNLKRATNSRGWTETAWTSAGSGCSAYVTAMSWQVETCSGKRAESDVSADADPNTGVAVYDSTMYRGAKGWLVFGGTSVSSPVISSIYALAGNATTLNASQSIYQNAGTAALNDVTSGNNNGGGSCSPSFICNAGVGYDGPTGNGTPNGITAF
jgi:subtilase family serine protease